MGDGHAIDVLLRRKEADLENSLSGSVVGCQSRSERDLVANYVGQWHL